MSVVPSGSPVCHGGEQWGGVLHRLRQHRDAPGSLQQQRPDDQTGKGTVSDVTPDIIQPLFIQGKAIETDVNTLCQSNNQNNTAIHKVNNMTVDIIPISYI